jgi:hypothetical protein
MSHLIITGIPRSGTTLAAAMIDQADNAFCLSEPDSHVELLQTSQSAEDFVARLALHFDSTRKSLLVGQSVLDKRQPDGQPVTNYFSDVIPGRPRQLTFMAVNVSRSGLTADFLLGVKHNALYASVLPEIVRCRKFRIVAIIRDPVAVLKSWRSVDLPISSGRLPAAEKFWPEMARLTQSDLELLEKQIRIFDLMCRRFAELSRALKIVRYEAFTVDPAQLFAAVGVSGEVRVPIHAETGTAHKRDTSVEESALSRRIQDLARDGSLPGICGFYLEYRASENREIFP